MPASEAQIAANRKNSLKSTGPKTPEGKDRSRRNAWKHGLACKGDSVPEAGARAVDDRLYVLAADLRPRSPMGMVLLQAVAVYSVRMERASRQESDALAIHVRHAVDDFDHERLDEADRLYDTLADGPSIGIRRLRRTPEGVERLLKGWQELRDDLTNEPVPIWTAGHLEQVALLTGSDPERARQSKLGLLSRGFWGDATAIGKGQGGEDAEVEAKAWGRAGLLERIDAEIEALEDHFETLDFELLELDRREAPGRALFDPSKEAALARRYEAAAARGFFKAKQQYEEAEAEFAARPEHAQGRPSAPPRRPEVAPSYASTPAPSAGLASNRQAAPSAGPGTARVAPPASSGPSEGVRRPDGQPSTAGRPLEPAR